MTLMIILMSDHECDVCWCGILWQNMFGDANRVSLVSSMKTLQRKIVFIINSGSFFLCFRILHPMIMKIMPDRPAFILWKTFSGHVLLLLYQSFTTDRLRRVRIYGQKRRYRPKRQVMNQKSEGQKRTITWSRFTTSSLPSASTSP